MERLISIYIVRSFGHNILVAKHLIESRNVFENLKLLVVTTCVNLHLK